MSATSKRDRALQAGIEPVTDKAMHTGDAPMPEHLAVELAVDMAAVPEPEIETPRPKARKKAKKENDDG